MRLSDFCFTSAGTAALVGMGLGIHMGAAQDFTLAPVRAHLDLLGWVTLSIYGLYHRGAGRAGGTMGWLQVTSGALGAVLMTAGLAVYLGAGREAFVPLIMAGSVLAVAGMVLFIALVLADALRATSPSFGSIAQSG